MSVLDGVEEVPSLEVRKMGETDKITMPTPRRVELGKCAGRAKQLGRLALRGIHSGASKLAAHLGMGIGQLGK